MLRASRSRRIIKGNAAAVASIKHGISPHHQRPESSRRLSNTSVEANSHALRSRIRTCVVRQHSRTHASHLRPFRSRSSTCSNTVSDNNYSGSTIGERRSQIKEKKTSSPTKWIAQYQGSIWEILPVAHDGVPSSRGAFITAISFLQRGRPSDSCMPPSVPDQPEQLQLQKSLNRAMGLQGSQSHCQVFTTSRARKTR